MAFEFSDISGGDWMSLAGGLLGAAAGASASGDRTTTSTSSKDPWAAAQPWMKSNMASGQQLQDYYQKNPFNDQQKTGYQNLFNGVDNFNQNTAPGLMDFANKGMTGGYQRQPVSQPGKGAGYGVAPQKSYFDANPDVASAFAANNYGMSADDFARTHYAKYGQSEGRAPVSALQSGATTQGPFSAAPSQAIGQVDWSKSNPYTNGSITSPAEKQAQLATQLQSTFGGLLGGSDGQGGWDGAFGTAGTPGQLDGLLGGLFGGGVGKDGGVSTGLGGFTLGIDGLASPNTIGTYGALGALGPLGMALNSAFGINDRMANRSAGSFNASVRDTDPSFNGAPGNGMGVSATAGPNGTGGAAANAAAAAAAAAAGMGEAAQGAAAQAAANATMAGASPAEAAAAGAAAAQGASGGGSDGGFGGSSVGGNDAHGGDSSHGTRGD